MPYEVLVHLMNEDPILAEVEELPAAGDNCLYLVNPRRRDGKPVHYLDRQAVQFIFPWTRITFIEVMPSEEHDDKLVEFFRD
jgi:hypothetical protein